MHIRNLTDTNKKVKIKYEASGDNSRWVCRNTGCSASLSSVNFDITKINGKKATMLTILD